ncbi:Trm112 family protein [Kitasatospora sp. LaBMicrA B282]|uniref:Trm112 family protein n=1 Tax=Kitasatospora sp. LaBMicrA B282 TaxID=3420949 RepID=UPI003D110E3A
MTIEPFLLEILVCPSCHAALRESATGADAAEQQAELVCTGTDCGLAYPVRDGIPVLLVDEARRPA